MMGNMLKEEQGSVTMRIKGGGPLGTITAVSDCMGNVRGYVQNPWVDFTEKEPGKLDVGAAVGCDGTLTIIKDIGLKEPYVGTIGLLSGEIAEDLAVYYVESEQIPTACALGVLIGVDQSVTAAGGYLIQLLPGADEEVISKIERGVAKVGSVSHALEGGLSARELLSAVLGGIPAGIPGGTACGIPLLLQQRTRIRCFDQYGPNRTGRHDPGAGRGRIDLSVLPTGFIISAGRSWRRCCPKHEKNMKKIREKVDMNTEV